jgi:hypothetical protein
MGSLFGGKSKVVVPPPPPPAPGPGTELTEVRAGGQELFRENLERSKQAGQEQEATRKALEEALGVSFEDLIAGFGAAELGLITGLRGLQAESLQGTEQEREAFQRQTGLTPEDYAGEEAARQLEIGRGFQGRYRTALEGGLPTDPGMQRRHIQEQRDLDERFRRALGSGYQLSSPYSTGLQDLLQRQGQETYLSGQYELERAGRIGYTLSPATQRILNTRQGLLGGVPNVSPYDISSRLSQTGLGFLETPPQFGQLTGEYNYDRALQAQNQQLQSQYQMQVLQAQTAAQNQKAQSQGGLLSGLLSAGAMIAAPYLAPALMPGMMGAGMSALGAGGSFASGTPGMNTVFAPGGWGG